MNRRQLAWFMALAMLTLLVVVSAPAFPQDAAPQQAAPEDAEEAAQAGETAADPMQEADATVETILREQEQLLSGERFTYDPDGRRDPFLNLFETMGVTPTGPRPRGIAGMLVTELDLVGIVKEPGGSDVALVMGSDNKGYFLRMGDSVFDGNVIAVDPRLGTVTFRQQVDDPRLIKPYRDIVKRLVPLDDEEIADE
jgi:Tfp pilus assembly protein PilP